MTQIGSRLRVLVSMINTVWLLGMILLNSLWARMRSGVARLADYRYWDYDQ